MWYYCHPRNACWFPNILCFMCSWMSAQPFKWILVPIVYQKNCVTKFMLWSPWKLLFYREKCSIKELGLFFFCSKILFSCNVHNPCLEQKTKRKTDCCTTWFTWSFTYKNVFNFDVALSSFISVHSCRTMIFFFIYNIISTHISHLYPKYFICI